MIGQAQAHEVTVIRRTEQGLTPSPICGTGQDAGANDRSSHGTSNEEDSPSRDGSTTVLRLEGLGDKRSRYGLGDRSTEASKVSSDGKAVEGAGSGEPDSAGNVEGPCENVGGSASDGLGDGIPEERTSTETKDTDTDSVGSSSDGGVEGDCNWVESLSKDGSSKNIYKSLSVPSSSGGRAKGSRRAYVQSSGRQPSR